MSRFKKNLFKLIIALSILALVIFGLFLFFFISNEAPIIRGEVIRDIVYKKDQTLDIYLPTQPVFDKIPVIVYVHGGAWIGGRKELLNANRINEAINRLRDKGYAVISPSYALASLTNSPFPDCIVDIFDAINWITKSAPQYSFDLENVGLIGESAGAHIAMMVAYSEPHLLSFLPKTKVEINYVVDIYGPVDLKKLYHMQTVEDINQHLEKLPQSLRQYFDIAHHLFGFDPEKDTLKARLFEERYSPINYVNANCPPTLIIQGDVDQIVPPGQSISLSHKLDSLNVEGEIHLLENVNHALRGINDAQKSDVQDWIVAFIEKHYNSDSAD